MSTQRRLSVNESIALLSRHKIKISKGEDFYNGSNYGKRYSILDSKDVDGVTPYLGLPVKVKAQGFIARGEIVQNFFNHDGKVFDTTITIDELIQLRLSNN